MTTVVYPFSAIVAQEEMKLAMMVAAVDPKIGGVLVFGDRGTGKSTIVRALADLLPTMTVVTGCPYRCSPDSRSQYCPAECVGRSNQSVKSQQISVPVVDLPLGATEDRVVGALDLEKALALGEKHFEPGLLAQANRGFLYIDEVNLLEDHLVDLLLDVAASGENVVEREGLSVRHPAQFVLIGSGNPEEGELRPQLLDRFGLSVEVETPKDLEIRVEVVRRRDAFDQDPVEFSKKWKASNGRLRSKLKKARAALGAVKAGDKVLEYSASLCSALGTDGLRGELTLIRAARVVAALNGEESVSDKHLKKVAAMALRHRLRKDPLDETGSTVRIERAVSDVFDS